MTPPIVTTALGHDGILQTSAHHAHVARSAPADETHLGRLSLRPAIGLLTRRVKRDEAVGRIHALEIARTSPRDAGNSWFWSELLWEGR